jgi:hypothetical protein
MTADDLLNRVLRSYPKEMTQKEFEENGNKQPLVDWLGMDRKHTDNVIELILTGKI